MRKKAVNISKRLNLLAFFLSVLVFLFCGFNVLSFMLSGNEIPADIALGSESDSTESQNLVNTFPKGSSEATVKSPDIVLTTNEDGSYGRQAILECLAILKDYITNAKTLSEDGTSGRGFSVETFGKVVAVPDIAADSYTIKQSTYEYCEEDCNGNVYREGCEIETSKSGKGRNAGDRYYYSDGTLRYQETGNVWLNGSKIESSYSSNVSEKQTNDSYSAWGLSFDENDLYLDKCSLTKEKASYKLTLNYKGSSIQREIDNQEIKGGAQRGSCSVLDLVVNITLTKKGKIAYVTKKTVTKMYVLNIVNTWVTTIKEDQIYFKEFTKDQTIKKI